MIDKEFEKLLRKLVSERRKDILFNPAFKSILADYARGEYKKEIKWLLSAIDEKVHLAIDKADDLSLCKKNKSKFYKMS